MSLGYDQPDYPGSVRPVHYECMFCHNAYPKIPVMEHAASPEMTFVEPLPEGIDCQRCHGPGQGHVDLTGSPSLHAAPCRGPFSYRPGVPLADFEIAFDRPG